MIVIVCYARNVMVKNGLLAAIAKIVVALIAIVHVWKKNDEKPKKKQTGNPKTNNHFISELGQ